MLLAPGYAQGGDEPRPPRASGQDRKFEHLTPEDGLSTDRVDFALQDSKGFAWFGTQDGLNRYDGYESRVFSTS